MSKKISRTFFAVVTLVLVTGCAAPMSKNELVAVKKIGIINGFPENPNYLKIGTTVFQNNTENIDSLRYKDLVSNQVEGYLKEKGYQPVEVKDKASLESGEVDMVIEIVPRDALSKPYTNGYGFFQRSFFGSKTPASSYVALNLVPSKKNSVNLFSAYYKENFQELGIVELPDKWGDLSEKQKEVFTENLKNNIQTTIRALIVTLGL
jgi:hypothetical protein